MKSVQYDRFLFLCVLSSGVSDSRYFTNEEDNKLNAIKGKVGRVLGITTYRKSKGKVPLFLPSALDGGEHHVHCTPGKRTAVLIEQEAVWSLEAYWAVHNSIQFIQIHYKSERGLVDTKLVVVHYLRHLWIKIQFKK